MSPDITVQAMLFAKWNAKERKKTSTEYGIKGKGKKFTEIFPGLSSLGAVVLRRMQRGCLFIGTIPRPKAATT